MGHKKRYTDQTIKAYERVTCFLVIGNFSLEQRWINQEGPVCAQKN